MEKLEVKVMKAKLGLLGKEHPGTLTNVNNLALALHTQGNKRAAELLHRRALELKEEVLGKEHPSTLTSVNNLAEVLRA